MAAAKRLRTENENNKKQRVMEEHVCADHYLSVEQLNALDIVSNIVCSHCQRSFSNKSALNTHLEKVHDGSGSPLAKK